MGSRGSLLGTRLVRYTERTRVYPKVSGLSHNEINNNNKHSLRSNTKDYDGKTHYTDSQNSDITVPGGRELYHLQFSLQAASPDTFGYTLVFENSFLAILQTSLVLKFSYFKYIFTVANLTANFALHMVRNCFPVFRKIFEKNCPCASLITMP
jgi:hypothetical protein